MWAWRLSLSKPPPALQGTAGRARPLERRVQQHQCSNALTPLLQLTLACRPQAGLLLLEWRGPLRRWCGCVAASYGGQRAALRVRAFESIQVEEWHRSYGEQWGASRGLFIS